MYECVEVYCLILIYDTLIFMITKCEYVIYTYCIITVEGHVLHLQEARRKTGLKVNYLLHVVDVSSQNVWRQGCFRLWITKNFNYIVACAWKKPPVCDIDLAHKTVFHFTYILCHLKFKYIANIRSMASLLEHNFSSLLPKG